MARERSPNRDKAFEIWQQSGGKIKLKDIADQLGVKDTQVRKWKSQDKWDDKLKGTLPITNGNVTNGKRNVTSKGGAPYGNKNALGNKGGAPKGNKNAKGHGPPKGSQNALKHGFFRKIFPDDEETQEIIESIEVKSPLDILWENIVIQYTAIARAQKIMFVQDQNDITQHLKRERHTENTTEREWEFQYPWDKHANFLQAQARAMQTLERLINKYEDLVEKYELKGYVVEEHRLRVEKLKVDISKITGDDGTTEDDGFIDALESRINDVWGDEDGEEA